MLFALWAIFRAVSRGAGAGGRLPLPRLWPGETNQSRSAIFNLPPGLSIYRSYISDATDWTMFAVVRPPAGAYDYDPDVPTLGMLRHGSSWTQTAMSGDSVMLDGRVAGTFSGVQAETWQVLAVQTDYEAGSGKQTAEVFLDGVSVGVDDSVSVEGGMGLTGGFDFFEHTNSTADSWFDGDVASIMLVEGDLTTAEVASRSQQLLDFRCSLGGPLGDIRAAFEYTPEAPTAGSFVTFDAGASETTEGQISSYTWDFGDGVTNTTTDTTTLHAYETAGTYSVQLIATAPSGAADTVVRDVEVGQADTDGPLAYWSPCASTGTSTLEDIVGGNDMPLFGSGDPSTEWVSGAKEYLVVERENGNDIRAEGNLPFDDTEFTFFALAREGSCGQTGGGSRCQLLSFEDDHGPDWSIGWGGGVLESGGWVTTGGVDFGDPGSGWHVITARFDTAPGGDHQLEMFVDGTQMGSTITWTDADAGGAITPEGFTRFFQRADRFDANEWGDFKFVGDVSAISYYGRAVSDSLIGAESSRMLSGSGCMGGAGQGPIADIEYEPEGPLVGDEVTFSGLGSSDPDGFLTGYAWDFDDGVTESGSVLGHTFSQAGTYTTQLTVTDNDGLTGVADTTLTVGELQGEMACTSSIESISNQDPERAFDIWTDDRDPDNLTVWATTWRTFDSPPWNATGAALVTGQSGAVSWEVYGGYPSGTGDPATMLDDDGKALRDSIAIRMPAPSGNDWTKNYTVSISGETGENTGEVQFRCSLNQISVNVSADADSYALGDPGRFAASASQAPGLSIDNFNVEATPPSGAGTTLCQKSGGAIFSCSGELPATEVGIWTLKATATGSGLEEATKTVTYEVTSN